MDVKFTKMHGSGNDFIIVDEWNKVIVAEDDKEAFVQSACQRHFGIGSDGLIFVSKSKSEDVNFLFYNPDGSRSEMCGNGIRCLGKYVFDRGHIREKHMSVETLAGVKKLELSVIGGSVVEVKVDMGAPQIRRGDAQVAGDPDDTFIDQRIMVHGFEYSISSIGMGNPHAVMFYDDVDGIDVKNIGSRIRNYKKVFPKGVNVHFIESVRDNEFRIRTFERGVEDETLACGTGICASAVATVLTGQADAKRQIIFNARGGKVKVELDTEGDDIKRVYLIGPAEEVFTGVIEL